VSGRPGRIPLAGAFVVLLGLFGGVLLIKPWFQAGNGTSATLVTIPPGATLDAAAHKLADAAVISSAGQFNLLVRLFGKPGAIKAGVYRFPANVSWRDDYRRLQKGNVVAVRVTIPEGLPAVLVAERLAAQPALTGAVAVPAEGSVLPDTYNFATGTTRAAALRTMQTAMSVELVKLWAERSAATVVKSPAEAVILASIVEKETGTAAERRLVAGVYSNRLRQGIKLDADPTVIYPLTHGKPLGRRIKRSELDADNGYNTYLRAGLPAGPIANPGRDAIAAVLDPASTKALYFVADGSGGHVFATTLAEQNANVTKWFALRRQRGEM
jgi:UPF0755 protein